MFREKRSSFFRNAKARSFWSMKRALPHPRTSQLFVISYYLLSSLYIDVDDSDSCYVISAAAPLEPDRRRRRRGRKCFSRNQTVKADPPKQSRFFFAKPNRVLETGFGQVTLATAAAGKLLPLPAKVHSLEHQTLVPSIVCVYFRVKTF
jgi:hypothetical protein